MEKTFDEKMFACLYAKLEFCYNPKKQELLHFVRLLDVMWEKQAKIPLVAGVGLEPTHSRL